MPLSTLETIDNLLEQAIEDTEGTEVHYKLRSARQLLTVLEEREGSLNDAIDESDLDENVRETLRDLGCLD